MEFLLVLAVLVAVVFVVTAPLRRPEAGRGVPGTAERDQGDGDGLPPGVGAGSRAAPDRAAFERESELSELEAAREAKYREIRDTQLDYETGKLSQQDFEALDTGLRRQALEILQRIDRLQPPAAGPPTLDRAEPGLRGPE